MAGRSRYVGAVAFSASQRDLYSGPQLRIRKRAIKAQRDFFHKGQRLRIPKAILLEIMLRDLTVEQSSGNRIGNVVISMLARRYRQECSRIEAPQASARYPR